LEPQANTIGSFVKPISNLFRIITKDTFGKIGLFIVGLVVILAIIGPYISPYGAFEIVRNADGSVARLEPPSFSHPFGTDVFGEDILSQTIIGSRISVIVGFVSAIFIGLIGTVAGLISGYFGGKVDNAIMRLTDIAYGIPFLPFAVVLVALLGTGTWIVIFAVVILYWRGGARVIRSQVLTLRERQYVLAAKAAGASSARIIIYHLLPNVFPLTLLYVIFGTAWAVLTEAGLSFLGLGTIGSISWGQMLYTAFITASIRSAWWWVLPPAATLTAFLVGIYFVGRACEEALNPKLRAN